MKKLIALALLVLISICVCAEELRINRLLPENRLVSLAVEPCLPDDFVALSPSGDLDLYEWTFWGPKEVLEAFFKNPDALSTPIIRMKLCTTPQSAIEDGSVQLWKEEFHRRGCTEIKESNLQWGSYPVYSLSATSPDANFHVAWVGLNEKGNWTLTFQMIDSADRSKATPEGIKLWENFLHHTEQLPPKLFMKANGQDIEEGHTVVDLYGAKMKIVAEQRESDNKLQVAVVPLQENLSFEFGDVHRECRDVELFNGKHILQILGTLTKDDGNSSLVMDLTLYAHVKKVPEFSIQNAAKKPIAIFME